MKPAAQVEASIGTPPGAARAHDDEHRQVLVLGPERVGRPCAARRPPGDLEAGVQKLRCRIVVDVLRVHRLDQTDVVDDAADVLHRIADHRPALAVRLERRDRPDDRIRRLPFDHRREPPVAHHRARQLFAVHLLERRLVVERVVLRERAEHVQVDHTLGLRREVRETRQPGMRVTGNQRLLRPGGRAQQLGEREPAEAHPGLQDERAPCLFKFVLHHIAPMVARAALHRSEYASGVFITTVVRLVNAASCTGSSSGPPGSRRRSTTARLPRGRSRTAGAARRSSRACAAISAGVG